MDRYLNLSFYQLEEDWYLDNPYKETNFTVRRCEPTDFGEDEQSQAYYHTWITDTYAFDIFCPDLNN